MERFIAFTLFIPVYIVLLYMFTNPKESFLFGRKWMFEDKKLEPSPEVIRHYKIMSVVLIFVITLLLIFL
ncbi:hypothetical protein [Clostridium tepidiprofundi]|uniref:hypothetical protein n=1 Tax=Clostridium tepidiprofundi TaxID=420412 RepID=UPI0008336239|nr:hypothetical protein [Clostridium tepidiprofundi]